MKGRTHPSYETTESRGWDEQTARRPQGAPRTVGLRVAKRGDVRPHEKHDCPRRGEGCYRDLRASAVRYEHTSKALRGTLKTNASHAGHMMMMMMKSHRPTKDEHAAARRQGAHTQPNLARTAEQEAAHARHAAEPQMAGPRRAHRPTRAPSTAPESPRRATSAENLSPRGCPRPLSVSS